MAFIAKRLSREKTLGERLKSLRDEHRIKISTLAATLQIPEKFLADLETGRYKDLPEEIYVRNFIRAYANAFGRDSAAFLDLYELEVAAARGSRKAERMAPAISIKKNDLLPTVLILRIAIAGILCLGLIAYLGYEVKMITSPPSLTIFEPTDNAVTKTGEITVRGKVGQEAQITINGENVLADSSGYFKETLRLQRGLNMIQISASKRRSKEKTIFLRVVYEEEAP